MATTTSLSFVLALAVFTLFFSPAFSTSRRALEHPKMQKGFRVRLKHVDSAYRQRGRNRLQRLKAMALVASSSSEIESPVLPGNGEYLMKLSIGTPPETYSAILDTGSDLIWTQCKPCSQCFDQSTPIFDPKKSSSFSKLPCSSQLCDALPHSSCKDSCEYLYTYGDYSSTQGILASETLTFGKASIMKERIQPSVAGGACGPSCPAATCTAQLTPKFSYCLTSVDETKTSTLLMGSLASVNASSSAIKTTPLIRNPSQPSFYYLSLEGISVGGTRLPIKKSTFSLQDDGSGGVIIDSGTTITYLEESAFNLVAKEFTTQIDLPVDSSGSTGLEVCFTLPSGSTKMEVPKMVFTLMEQTGIAGRKLQCDRAWSAAIAGASSGCLAMELTCLFLAMFSSKTWWCSMILTRKLYHSFLHTVICFDLV
uniref:Peptidase A1 domain-containing protein n=1 Tax=Salix viminalis TaxID=40686 RepID=A0A6N2K7F7_SALVM